MSPVFEWDEEKVHKNLRKYKISFFHAPLIATMPDPDHSDDEERFIAIGYSNKNCLLFVAFTERGNKTRIINCQKAEPIEREIYEEI